MGALAMFILQNDDDEIDDESGGTMLAQDRRPEDA